MQPKVPKIGPILSDTLRWPPSCLTSADVAQAQQGQTSHFAVEGWGVEGQDYMSVTAMTKRGGDSTLQASCRTPQKLSQNLQSSKFFADSPSEFPQAPPTPPPPFPALSTRRPKYPMRDLERKST